MGCSCWRWCMSCCGPTSVDLEFLARYTNAPWLVVRNPGGADDGLFARDEDGKPLAWDRARGAMDAAAARPLARDGRRLHPAGWPPRAAGVPPDGGALPRRRNTRRRRWPSAAASRPSASAASPPRSPMSPSTSRSCWTSPGPMSRAAGTRRMVGRPVAFHAMRGISRAFQRLPHLPRAAPAADAARRRRYARFLALQVALPAADPARAPARPARAPSRTRRSPATSCPSRTGRTTCWWTRPASRCASTRPSPGKRRSALHGMMHTVIGNAGARRSLPDRHAVHVHGQHGLEQRDEPRRGDPHPDGEARGRRIRASRTSSTRTPTSPRRCPMPT